MSDDTHAELLGKLDWLAEARNLAYGGSWRAAASTINRGLGRPTNFPSEEEAKDCVEAYFYELLEQDDYILASALAWERAMFEQRPRHVKRVFDAIRDHDLLILLGASSLGKSFILTGWCVLDWLRDPDDTGFKITAVDAGNLRGNLWANIRTMVELSLFQTPLPPIITDSQQRMSMRSRKGRPDTGIESVLYPMTNNPKGKLKGIHPKPVRPPPGHPIWGRLTRQRIVVDDAQNVAEGVRKDFGSPRSTVDKRTHLMKIILTCNPEEEDAWVVRMAEPPQGWREEDKEDLFEWEGKDGFHVLRLDGAQFENVTHRKILYPGFLTWEGFSGSLGPEMEETADHSVFARGWPPSGRARDVVIPTSWYESSLGEPIFVGPVHNVAGFDAAYLIDTGCLALCRYGLASGYIDFEGTEHEFQSRRADGEVENRHCMVVDQLIHMTAKDPVGMGSELRAWCDKVGIDPEDVTLDKTGNAYGIFSHLQNFWGAVHGIHWKSAPTERKIMADDKEGAKIQCRDIVSELYWTIRQWIRPSLRAFFINPMCDHKEKLKKQATSRRWKYDESNRVKVESKEDYTKRPQNPSPDEMDSVVMAAFAVRRKGLSLPSNVNEQEVTTQMKKKRKMEDQTSDSNPALTGRRNWNAPSLTMASPTLRRQGIGDTPEEIMEGLRTRR